jgi:hypothetical protein
MCFEGRAGGESVALTMPLLASKGYREALAGAVVGDQTRRIYAAQ